MKAKLNRVCWLPQHTNGTTAVWLMNGSNLIAGGELLNGSLGWTVRTLGDFNGDGKTDIVWQHTNGTTAVWLMNGLNLIAGGELLNGSLGWSPGLVDSTIN